MNKMIATLAAIGVAGSFAGPALAQETETMTPETTAPESTAPQGMDFATVDADASGDITLEEVQAVVPDFSEELYGQADMDASGSLNEEEFNTLVSSGALAPTPAE